MTFYWWSHWFWITLLGNILLSIVIVHAYPSQDVAAEYNNNNNRDPKSTTRLYQTTTTIIWATSAPPPSQKALDGGVAAQEAPVIEGRTAAGDEVEDVGVEDEDEDVMEEPEAEPEPESEPGSQSGLLEEEQAEAEEEEEASLVDGDGAAAAGDRSESQEFEYKRSADEGSANGTRPQVESASDGMQVAPEGVEGAKGGQAEAKNSTRQEKELHVTDAHNNYSNFSANPMPSTNGPGLKTAGSSPSPGSSPAAVGGPSTAEWLGSIVQAVAAEDRPDSDPVAGEKAPFTLENVNKAEEIVRAENEHRSRKSKVLSAEYRHTDRFINYSTESKNLLARSASTAPNEFDGDEGNISSEALAIQRTYFLDASAISAICFAVFGICCTVGTIGIVLYRRRYLNKPQALSEPDSSVYIDDSTMRDNSDEMYSLDNDSFLNSLEAMTIQNYWTDTVKHTKL